MGNKNGKTRTKNGKTRTIEENRETITKNGFVITAFDRVTLKYIEGNKRAFKESKGLFIVVSVLTVGGFNAALHGTNDGWEEIGRARVYQYDNTDYGSEYEALRAAKYDAGDYEGAINDYNEAIRLNPDAKANRIAIAAAKVSSREKSNKSSRAAITRR